MAYLETRGLCKSFGENHVLSDISIQAERNELISLLGVSGVGKTTLFHLISGVGTPDEGQVLLDGCDITAAPGKISYMLQKDLLLEYHRVVDNAALPLVLRGMNKRQAREKAAALFPAFGLSGTELLYPKALSGGMRQRVALLRTYLASSGVVLLDEPFSALDHITKGAMHTWYLDVAQQFKLTTLFITHDMDEAIKLSSRIYLLTGKPGRITQEIVIDRPNCDAAEFQLTPAFLEYKREISAMLC